MLKATVTKHSLIFKQAGGTSRGVLHEKPSWFLKVFDDKNPEVLGIGECSIIPHLSPDNLKEIESILYNISKDVSAFRGADLIEFPAVQFGLETALLDLKNKGQRILFPSEFTNRGKSIDINGLIWMGSKKFMRTQVTEKIENGFKCIKLKIGALNFEDEIEILKEIRKNFNAETIELRVDANGAFAPDEALEKLKRLSDFQIHSIEQPINIGQFKKMAELCRITPLPIALDEELIGISDFAKKQKLLETIQPQYLILKPSLLGGLKKSEEWISLAEKHKIGWWVTSALESNIGLNAIAQWTYQLNNPMPQGLGTGKLFINNIPSPLNIKNAKLIYQPKINWNLNSIS